MEEDQTRESRILSISLEALEENPELWECYFKNVIVQTLCLERTEGISHEILWTFFSKLCEEKTILMRAVRLHVHMSTSHLVRKANIFRCLDQIAEMSTFALSQLSHINTHSKQKLMDMVKDLRNKNPLGTCESLSEFVISHLFNALVGAAYCHGTEYPWEPVKNMDTMVAWHDSYRYSMFTSSRVIVIEGSHSIEAIHIYTTARIRVEPSCVCLKTFSYPMILSL